MFIRAISLLLLLVLAVLVSWRQDPTDSADQRQEIDALVGKTALEPQFERILDQRGSAPPDTAVHQSHVVRRRNDIVLPDFVNIYRRLNEQNESVEFPLEIFDGQQIRVRVVRATAQAAGRGISIRGVITDAPGSLVALAQVGAAVSGSVQIPTQDLILALRQMEGRTYLEEIDVAQLGECATCQESEIDLQPVNPESPPSS